MENNVDVMHDIKKHEDGNYGSNLAIAEPQE